MKVLLDTNIIIHREASTVVNEDIGVLFKWLDELGHIKCIHPITIQELSSYADPKAVKTINIKIENYRALKTQSPVSTTVQSLSDKMDHDDSDRNDTLILNELYNDRVDILITEDRKIMDKAVSLGISDKVFTVEAYLEKVTAENPGLVDYENLTVQKKLFGELDTTEDFFLPLREAYPGFDTWFNRKADETAYVCHSDGKIAAFLYLKLEGEHEDYSNIDPPFSRKKRLKIGTFKVALNGFRLGERFLKIVFDNALCLAVDEIYVTAFTSTIEQQRLVRLLEDYGFVFHGHKTTGDQQESVYVRHFIPTVNHLSPKSTYPFFTTTRGIFIVPIYGQYHTDLFPDSILNNESPADFIENEPHRNAIQKTYISRAIDRDVRTGDIVVFYRTGGRYRGVVTTVGIVEDVIFNIPSENDFIRLCKKRTVFSNDELSAQWNYKRNYRPFIVNFLYAYSFPKRINMQRLIEIGVIADINSAPRGFKAITVQNFRDILRECQVNENIAVD